MESAAWEFWPEVSQGNLFVIYTWPWKESKLLPLCCTTTPITEIAAAIREGCGEGEKDHKTALQPQDRGPGTEDGGPCSLGHHEVQVNPQESWARAPFSMTPNDLWSNRVESWAHWRVLGYSCDMIALPFVFMQLNKSWPHPPAKCSAGPPVSGTKQRQAIGIEGAQHPQIKKGKRTSGMKAETETDFTPCEYQFQICQAHKRSPAKNTTNKGRNPRADRSCFSSCDEVAKGSLPPTLARV